MTAGGLAVALPRAPRCDWCRRHACGLDETGGYECARCCALRGGPGPLVHLAALCARLGLPAPDALAARLGLPLDAVYYRVEAYGIRYVVYKRAKGVARYPYRGGAYTTGQLAALAGLSQALINNRLTLGWSVDAAVETPRDPRRARAGRPRRRA